jgi:hypothetical protein
MKYLHTLNHLIVVVDSIVTDNLTAAISVCALVTALWSVFT